MGKASITSRNSQKQRRSRSFPAKTAIALIAIALLAISSALYTHEMLIENVNRERLAQLSKLEADKFASEITQEIKFQQKKLERFADRTAVKAALESGSSIALETVTSSLQSTYPEALSTRLLTLERQDRLGSDKTEMSFIELDMVNRAERDESVPPEAMKTESGWRLIFVARVAGADPESSTGTLLLALPMKPLLQQLITMNSTKGQIKLLRKAQHRDLLIFQSGDGGANASTLVDIKGSYWRLMFKPSAEFVENTSKSPVLLFSLHAIVAALLMVLTWWFTGRPGLSSGQASQETNVIDPETLRQKNASKDILDVEISSDDADILVLEEHMLEPSDEKATLNESHIVLPDNVFRAYDIRGKTDTEITPQFAHILGRAFASEALEAGEKSVFVARDGRTLSPQLCEELIAGISSTGCNVIDLGAVPTPLLYFATCEVDGSHSGIMVTASHNSAEYNGFKMVLQGKTLVAEDVQQIKTRMMANSAFEGQGEVSEYQVIPEYIDRIFSDVALAGSVKLVIDAGNGITGNVAPLLFEELGCEVVPLYCDIDGSFPNHDPDPTIVDNLQDLIRTVQETDADLGVALDGDGDRLVVVTPKGQIIWPDRLLMLFAKDIVSGNPGADVLFDVKSTRELNSLISSYGGRPIMWKTGHSNMKTKMQETGALIGGEMSGHIFFKDRWYGFDDGMYATARMLEIMTLRDQDIDSLFDSFPALPSTPEIKITVAEERKFGLIEQLKQQGKFGDARINPLDGMRVEFPEGWGLVRASNTSPALTLRFEAESQEKLLQIQKLFRQELLKIDSTLEIPF